jgi:heat shock protein HspQ
MIRIARALDVHRRPKFRPGDLVVHRRYGYRGVIVNMDRRRAAETWSRGEPARCERGQPWYHVLVHGTVGRTYAAQASLLPDRTGEPIDHPLVAEFFSAFDGRRYRRNRRPWPDCR